MSCEECNNIVVLVRASLARVKGQKTSKSSTIGREYGLVRTSTATILLLAARSNNRHR